MTLDPEPGESVTLEVSGGKVHLLKSLLSKEDLDETIQRIRIEIDWKPEAEPDTETETPTPEPIETPSEPPDTDSKAEKIKEGLNPDESKDGQQQPNGPVVHSNEPDITYPDNPDLDELPHRTLNPDTANWAVLLGLFNSSGFIKAKRLEKRLKGTTLEYNYSTLASSLTWAVQNGLVCWKRPDSGVKRIYQLTQFGRDYIKATAEAKDESLELQSAEKGAK